MRQKGEGESRKLPKKKVPNKAAHPSFSLAHGPLAVLGLSVQRRVRFRLLLSLTATETGAACPHALLPSSVYGGGEEVEHQTEVREREKKKKKNHRSAHSRNRDQKKWSRDVI